MTAMTATRTPEPRSPTTARPICRSPAGGRGHAARPRSGSDASLVAVIVIGGWQWFTSAGWVDKFFYGQPSGIWDSLVRLFTQGTAFGTIWENLWITVQEAFLGLRRSAPSPASCFGILLGSNRYLASVFGPYIKIVNSIPRIVLGSIFIVAFGLGVVPKVLLAAVLVFFVVFFNAFQGVREVDQNLVANVRVLGASPLQVARHVTIPSAMTWIIASLHTAFGFAIIGALVAEVLGAQHGIGLIISQAQGNFDPNTVFACMVIIAVVTLGAEYLITLLEQRAAEVAAAEPLRGPGHLTPVADLHTDARTPASLGTTKGTHPHEQAHHLRRRRSRGIVALSLAACSSGSGVRQCRRLSGAASMPTVKMMVGGIDKQIYLPVPARPEPRLLQEVRRQRGALDRAERRRRRRGRDGVRPGRHGRRLVHPHGRLPVQGQGRHQPRAALRRSGRAR